MLLMEIGAPRSTWIHCGKALFALSQYDGALALESFARDATYSCTELLVVMVLPIAKLVPGGTTSAPIPDSAIVTVGALLAIVTFPVRLPATVGRKFTLIVQVALAPSVAPQLLVCRKSPLALIELSVAATVPVFVSCTV